jgi:hypothetical protein
MGGKVDKREESYEFDLERKGRGRESRSYFVGSHSSYILSIPDDTSSSEETQYIPYLAPVRLVGTFASGLQDTYQVTITHQSRWGFYIYDNGDCVKTTALVQDVQVTIRDQGGVVLGTSTAATVCFLY